MLSSGRQASGCPIVEMAATTIQLFRSKQSGPGRVTCGPLQGLCSKDLPGQHSILSMLGNIFDESIAET